MGDKFHIHYSNRTSRPPRTPRAYTTQPCDARPSPPTAAMGPVAHPTLMTQRGGLLLATLEILVGGGGDKCSTASTPHQHRKGPSNTDTNAKHDSSVHHIPRTLLQARGPKTIRGKRRLPALPASLTPDAPLPFPVPPSQPWNHTPHPAATTHAPMNKSPTYRKVFANKIATPKTTTITLSSSEHGG